MDEGVELYGKIGKAQYALALQNGGMPMTQDFHADKAMRAASVTTQRNGCIERKRNANRRFGCQKKFISELWFGSGWIRSLASGNTTLFHANLLEGDVQVRLAGAQFKAAGGYINYDDNDPHGCQSPRCLSLLRSRESKS